MNNALTQVRDVSIGGIFGEGDRLIAESAGALLLVLALLAVMNVVMREHGWQRDTRQAFFFAARLGLSAVVVLPIVADAQRQSTPMVVAACAWPAVLMFERANGVVADKRVYANATILLGLWAAVVWHYELLPAYGVLGATVIWKFFLHAREQNQGTPAARVERIAWNLSIACLGAALFALDHGTRAGVFSTTEIADVTDLVGIAVVAPLLLVALTFRTVRNR
jgi:hypothetical protein